MLPLTRCMEEDQKEKLNQIFKEDFKKLNMLLEENGFSTCESLNMTSFKVDDVSNNLNNNLRNRVRKNYDEYAIVKKPSHIISSNGEEEKVEKDEQDYVLQTPSSINVLMRQKIFVNADNNQKHYKGISKILI